ncbi:hypothetical protein RND71_012881 [Anisodus tanguticus]|uniref:VQ domain-containing protein n=1 Tax=Anisodus tanguticus TaxID=243964 RepID=A0AAE1SE65_9SOLA|nr:hypothetical protein RND71_012881 [Anisodus tanguticus]
MGKKVRDEASKSQKKQFNNLIKLLKPKVYITHSSNFKNLVQQLTGNNFGSSSSSSPMISSSPPLPPPDHHDHDQRLQSIHQYYYQEYSQELSVDSSEGSIPSSININMLHEPCFSLLDNSINSMASQETDISEEYYRNIEAWLLEMDSYSTNYYHEQVSVDAYGYDLSTLL